VLVGVNGAAAALSAAGVPLAAGDGAAPVFCCFVAGLSTSASRCALLATGAAGADLLDAGAAGADLLDAGAAGADLLDAGAAGADFLSAALPFASVPPLAFGSSLMPASACAAALVSVVVVRFTSAAASTSGALFAGSAGAVVFPATANPQQKASAVRRVGLIFCSCA